MAQEQITYELECACFLCRKKRRVTLPKGQEPNEWCSGRKMIVANSYPALPKAVSPR